MKYKYTTDRNYEHFSAGRVLKSQPGMTSFPVRLASEIFQQCLAYRENPAPVRVYDPCGGGGYLLTVLGFLHGRNIASLLCSDIRQRAVQLAKENLALLSADGLARREYDLQAMVNSYDKASHREALASVPLLYERLPTNPLATAVYTSDALTRTLASSSVDVLISDVPYGDVVNWQSDTHDPITRLLDAQYAVLSVDTIVAIITRKDQKIIHPHYERLKHSTIGKRRISFLRPIQ